MRPPDFVLYHAGCVDGFTAAWVAWKRFRNSTFIPVQYGEDLPVEVVDAVENRRPVIHILDFTFPRETMQYLADVSYLVVCDHHKTGRENLAGLLDCGHNIRFDIDKSGARLAWELYYPSRSVPSLIEYVEDRDLWKWSKMFSREINAFFGSFDLGNFDLWEELAADLHSSHGRANYAREGASILRAQKQLIKRALDQVGLVEIFDEGGRGIDAHRWAVPAVNSSLLHSEIGHALLEKFLQYPFACVYREVHSKGIRVYNLRSRRPEEADVANIARRFYGGGHPTAAGFTTVTKPDMNGYFYAVKSSESLGSPYVHHCYGGILK